MFTSDASSKCPYCGNGILHQGVCPSVKAFEYYQDGTIKRVEFKTGNDYPPITAVGNWAGTGSTDDIRSFPYPHIPYV